MFCFSIRTSGPPLWCGTIKVKTEVKTELRLSHTYYLRYKPTQWKKEHQVFRKFFLDSLARNYDIQHIFLPGLIEFRLGFIEES